MDVSMLSQFVIHSPLAHYVVLFKNCRSKKSWDFNQSITSKKIGFVNEDFV